jgi:hypothetical protein
VAARKKGEVVSLQCARCGWSNEVPLRDTVDSTVVACVHCGASIYWHRCGTCGLCYLGEATPACPLCDAPPLDEDLELG